MISSSSKSRQIIAGVHSLFANIIATGLSSKFGLPDFRKPNLMSCFVILNLIGFRGLSLLTFTR